MPREHIAKKQPRPAQGRLDLVYACGVIAICAAVITGLAWTRPTRTDTVLRYEQAGSLSYSATTARDSIYGAGGLKSGEPIYVSAVGRVRFVYDYRLQAPESTNVSGTAQLVAVMSNGQGISRSIALGAPISFRGPSFVATGRLDTSWLVATAKSFEQAGLVGAAYTVTISPSVLIRGVIGGIPLTASLDKTAAFTFNGGALVPNGTPPSFSTSSAASQTGGTSGAPAPDLAVSVPGSVTLPRSAAAMLPFGLPVADARTGGPVAMLVALLAGWLFGRRLYKQASSDDEPVRIAARHGSSLIEATSLPSRPEVVVVELSAFEGLLQVARKLESPILHRSGDEDVYAVVDTGTLYRYGTRGPEAGALHVQPAGARTNGHVQARDELLL